MPVELFRGDDDGKMVAATNLMLQRVVSFDWASTSVGAIENWPEELRSLCRTVLLSSTPMSVLLGRDGVCLFNDAVRGIFGHTFESALGKPVVEALPQAARFYVEALASSFAGRSSSFHDVPLNLQRGGEQHKAWFDLDLTPIVDVNRQVLGVLLVSIETTARVQALIDLRNARERLELALESGGIVGAWDLDLATDIVHSDERFARLHGVDPELAKSGADDALFTAGIHPDDAAFVKSAFQQGMIDGTYRCQHRVVGPEGIRWIICSGRFRYETDGTARSFIGTAVDVTEQIETAAALSLSEKRFRAYAETLPHVIFSWDREGNPTYANQRWYEITGRDEDDPLALAWEGYVHPDDKTIALANLRHAIVRQAKFDTSVRVQSRSGDYRWMRAIAVPIHNTYGLLTSWIGTLTDIHEAKQLEAERELVSQELDHRLKNFFALAQSLVTITARENLSVAAFADRLRGRLAALHESHGLVRTANKVAGTPGRHSLQNLIRKLVAPYDNATAAERIVVEGDDILLESDKVTPFALVFHELATNAAKYGALSAPDGILKVRCFRSNDTFQVVWKEKIAATAPANTGQDGGFGSRLIGLVVDAQLKGQFTRDVETDGVRIALSFLAPET
ncbi:PAS domain S-box protein [Hyphomicrobium sp. MC8b]|uniref:PAS domain S-box protein n=1 Tax=Hyphomicrobium sp. MC8b TaxID=300273 RepID=UPI00391DA1A0